MGWPVSPDSVAVFTGIGIFQAREQFRPLYAWLSIQLPDCGIGGFLRSFKVGVDLAKPCPEPPVFGALK
jgi:hypothetical protein